MGGWDKSKALKLETTPAEFPWWHGEATVPKGQDIEYKFAIVGAAGFTWENGYNRNLNIPMNKDQLEFNALTFGQAERENSDSESQAYEYETSMYQSTDLCGGQTVTASHTASYVEQPKEKSLSRMRGTTGESSLEQTSQINGQRDPSKISHKAETEFVASSNQNLPSVSNASVTDDGAVNKKPARFLSVLKTGLGILTLPITVPVGGVFALCVGLCNLVYRTLSSISAMMFDHSSEEFEKVLIKTVQNMEVTMKKMERSLMESEEAVKRRVEEIKDLEANYVEEHNRYLQVLQERNASETSFVSIAAALRKDLTEMEETASKSLKRSKEEYTAYFENIKQEMAQSLSKFSRDLQDLGSSTLTESQKLRSNFDAALENHSRRLQESMDLCLKFDHELSHTRKHVKEVESNLEKMMNDQSQRVDALKGEVSSMQNEYHNKLARVTASSDKLTSELSQAKTDLITLRTHNHEIQRKIVNISENSRMMVPRSLAQGQNITTKAQHIEFVRSELNKVRRFHAEEINRLESMLNALSATAPSETSILADELIEKSVRPTAKDNKKLSDFDKLASFCSNSVSESDHHEGENQVLHSEMFSESLKAESMKDTCENSASKHSEITSHVVQSKEMAAEREDISKLELAKPDPKNDEKRVETSTISSQEGPTEKIKCADPIKDADVKLECFAVRPSHTQDEVQAQQIDSSSRADDSDGECVEHAHERVSEQLLNAKLEGNEQDEGGLFCAVEPYLNLSPKSKQARARLNTKERKLTHARPSMASKGTAVKL
ncbi:hypothetical protein GUITHDRAFT_137576 [Guillardia theta CCMP2712]|uniref:CBM20 domain-containing protein n=1 Tax=Guillardia theta (strain CCMP2712) TaxID=905079 RepID=L1JFW6_GUITC|nr:hypothetical protein GUITHDRAFT_137576 [Guillardia theta CCMP2712]EKX47408.1 hypothetical protein GUITHDRAFT_137576 [Guillardia theta CCMP2712]|eukprot:XP_005834388.1 hypothetical protein GUITHDRAFT_137576 [Guillardia theta CCMP2712]